MSSKKLSEERHRLLTKFNASQQADILRIIVLTEKIKEQEPNQ